MRTFTWLSNTISTSRRDFLWNSAWLALPPLSRGVSPAGDVRSSRVARDGRRFGQADRSAELGSFPYHTAERVRAIVGASHGNLDAVRSLVTEQPALAKASWDWGFGDWETPLGAASHVGRRDIAEFLIAHGARPTVFSEAMMGRSASVRAILEADPGVYGVPGPHGISLMRHARAGGTAAAPVVEYLLDRFGPDEGPFGHTADPATAARYSGRFRFDTDPQVVLAVGVTGGEDRWLAVGVDPLPSSRLLPVEGEADVFHPTGSPAVRLRFHVVEGRAERLSVEDGPFAAVGERVPG